MTNTEQDQDPPEDRGVLKYQRDDNFFRQPITPADLNDTPRVEFDDFANKDEYLKCIKDLPFIVFIDVSDVAKYLRVINIDGIGALDVKRIAEIVTDCLGNESDIPDMLWGAFENEVAAEIQAKLGLEDSDTSAILGSGPFSSSMDVLYEIASVVQRYLINARFPIVENESIYGVVEYSKGILALRVKAYEEFVEAYGGREYIDQPIKPSPAGLLSGGFEGQVDLGQIDKPAALIPPLTGNFTLEGHLGPDGLRYVSLDLDIGTDKQRRLMFSHEPTDDELVDTAVALKEMLKDAVQEHTFRLSGATWRPEPASELEQFGSFDEQDKWVNADGTKPVDNMVLYNDNPKWR